MPLEEPYLIKDLYRNYPFDGDLVTHGDDHLRNIKTAILNTFPLILGPLDATLTWMQDFLKTFELQTDNTIKFNTPYYIRPGALTAVPNTLQELYVTKDQRILRREPLPPLGTIIESLLSLTEINTKYGTDKDGKVLWARLDGGSITGSKLATLAGITNLPNTYTQATKSVQAFLAAPKDGEILNSYYPFNTNVTPIKVTFNEQSHGDTQHGDTTHRHKYNRISGTTNPDRKTRSGGTLIANDVGTALDTTIFTNTVTNEDSHDHDLTVTWQDETAPYGFQINFFIRIN